MALRQILCTLVQSIHYSQELHIVAQKVGDLDLIGDTDTGTFSSWYPGTSIDRFSTTCTAHCTTHPGMGANPPSHRLQVHMEGTVQWHRLGESLPALPASQNSPPRTGTVAAHTGTHSRHQHIQVCLVGPLQASKGFTHLFTVMDRTSQSQPIAAITTVDCANARFQGVSELIWCPEGYHIGPRGPVHLLPVGHLVQSAQHPDTQLTICSPMAWWSTSIAAT